MDIGLGAGNGVASFSNLEIDTAGSKQLTAGATGLTNGVSSSFTVNPALASRLTIQTQPPATATAGTSFSSATVVRVEDAFGNLVNSDNSTSVSATLGAGSASLQGTTTATAASGLATFSTPSAAFSPSTGVTTYRSL